MEDEKNKHHSEVLSISTQLETANQALQKELSAVDSYKKQVEQLEKDIEIHQQTIHNSEQSIADLTSSLDQANHEKINLEKELKSLKENEIQLKQTLQAEIDAIDKENTDLKGQITQQQQKIESLQTSIGKLNQDKIKLENELDDTRIKLEQETQEKKILEGDLHRSKLDQGEQVVSLREELATRDAKLKELQETIHTLHKEHTDSERQIAALNRSLVQSKESNEALQAEKERLLQAFIFCLQRSIRQFQV